ncbi:BZ3500_MvSof-1268-A1-R1_Chr3-3g06452 [Microbotryum saponariae]|uniref:BZ3500_MvSof-1268-A1-R1_Chr3-3g06452 protein n=1 Tax=Microbotryum saponariae TaxID=289078 RepID=A0A2X0KV89_9BASI|nr:BZ3500_MvSof-1268-A1-R1_Chr3-3g06452 [Microbotryum saponariae]SDA04419.1 BZ3501_MvSof-1269-A2-R1_Chr3-2g06139 [Microbotryum saponariae]
MARTKANDSNVFKSKKGRLHLLATDKERAFDRRGSTVNRLETSDDAFGGDEDEFHRQRDSILFEHTNASRNDKNGKSIASMPSNLGDLSDDDEIYGLDLPSQDEHEHDEEDDDQGEDEEPAQRKQFKRAPVDDTNKGRFSKSSAATHEKEDAADSQDDDDDDSDAHDRAPPKPSKLQARNDDDNDDDDDDGADREGAQDSDDEDTWAPGSYHASRRAPGEADSEDDEALELEEAEARRLQKKSKTALAAEDYGLDEAEDELEGTSTNHTRFEEEDAASNANSAQVQVEWTEENAIAHLLKHNPENLALLDDLTRIAERIKVVETALVDLRKGGEQSGEEHQALPIVELEHQALVTYLPTLTFYFSLLLSPHPSRELLTAVLARLSSLRTALASMEELELTTQLDDDSDAEHSGHSGDDQEGMELSEVWDKGGMQAVGGEDDDEDSDADEEDDEDDEEDDLDADMAELAEADFDFDSDEFDSDLEDERTGSMLASMDDAELEALMEQMKGDRNADALIAKVRDIQAAKKAGQAASDSKKASKAATKESNQKDRVKKPKKQVVIPELPALSSAPASRKKASRVDAWAADDYLDPTSLAHGDSADKASTRHSLRFHVSQVSQKEKRRNEGNGRRVGGDDDLPRRSKENARREVLKRQQHGVATSATGAALDDDDWGEDDLRVAKTVRGSNSGESGEGGEDGPSGLDYYEQVAAESKAGRLAKKAKYDEERQAEKEELMSLADSSVDGPRGATRTIMANKGLTPRRSKASRNSRVKKRLQYDKALKKVASMKAVYKGGDRSNYEGEKSGIGKNTVKSVRLNK